MNIQSQSIEISECTKYLMLELGTPNELPTVEKGLYHHRNFRDWIVEDHRMIKCIANSISDTNI